MISSILTARLVAKICMLYFSLCTVMKTHNDPCGLAVSLNDAFTSPSSCTKKDNIGELCNMGNF